MTFHHWDTDPFTGIWLCQPCHNIVHLKGNKSAQIQSIEEWFIQYLKVKEKPIVVQNMNTRYKQNRYFEVMKRK